MSHTDEGFDGNRAASNIKRGGGRNRSSSYQDRETERDRGTFKEKSVIGYYGYWVQLTYFSVISAMFGLYFAFKGGEGGIKNAVICLMISGLCDAFDGRVASFKKRNSRELNYGIQIDSMADLVSFGVLPIAIGYAVAVHNAAVFGTLNAVIAAFYVLTALMRLAYYNVTEEEMQSRNEKRRYFEGMPTTTVAILIPIVYFVCTMTRPEFFPKMYNAMLVFIAAMFILRIRIPKPRGVAKTILILFGLLVMAAVLLFAGGGQAG